MNTRINSTIYDSMKCRVFLFSQQKIESYNNRRAERYCNIIIKHNFII